MSEGVFFNRSYKNLEETIKLNLSKLPKLKVENIKVDSNLKTCIRVSTDGLFRGTILNYPIIDVIVSDRYVEITGIIVGKLYSGLVLILEYIDGSKFYVLEDFSLEKADVISHYISSTYKIALGREVTEEEFNEWYYRLQEPHVNVEYEFIRNIVLSDEFLKDIKNIDTFISKVYGVIFRREINKEDFTYWKTKYSENILKESEDIVKNIIIEQMIHYKRFEYSSKN